MAVETLPCLSCTPKRMGKVNQLGWTSGQSFKAYGVRFGLRVNEPDVLERVGSYLPLGWQPTDASEVDVLFSLRMASPGQCQGTRPYHLLYANARLIARTLDQNELYRSLEQHTQLSTALLARNCLFVHAGVVGWQNRAIVIPGRSMTGKTTLVKTLVEAGAVYYSDEFAILDQEGQVHPYPLPLSVRNANGHKAREYSVQALGGRAGTKAILVELVVVTEYRAGATWRPRRLSPGKALLALMDNTVAARRMPAHSMPILKQAVSRATTLKSRRGEAEKMVKDVLNRVQIQRSLKTPGDHQYE